MEVTMSSTQTVNSHGTEIPATAVDLKLEVVPLPVADVERAKRFYEGLGWRLDADFASGEEWRVVSGRATRRPCPARFRERSSSLTTSKQRAPNSSDMAWT
jgi:hypothetical protein